MKRKHKLPAPRLPELEPPPAYLTLPTMYGDLVEPELRVFEAETEYTLHHPNREPVAAPPVPHDDEHAA